MVDGFELLVFEVESAPRAVMVQGDGFPYRISDATPQFSEDKINTIKDHRLVLRRRLVAHLWSSFAVTPRVRRPAQEVIEHQPARSLSRWGHDA